MKNLASEPLDEEIQVDLVKAVEAYDLFSPSGQDKAADRGQGGQKALLFNKALQNVLVEMRASFHPNEKLLGSKQTISNWRLNPHVGPIRKRKCVLLAVLSLTGIDISKRSILARTPVHFSPVAELGEMKAQRITNDPEQVEEVLYHLVLTSALFKKARMRVMTSWIKDAKGGDMEIGNVEYGLSEARIVPQFRDLEWVDWCRRIPTDENRALGRADGCVMLWSDQRQAWLVQPKEPGALMARIEGVMLAVVRGMRGAFADIQISANRDQIEDDFQIRDGRTREYVELRADEKLRARERLIALVLGQNNRSNPIIAMHRCKLP